ncbi:MAG: peptidase M48 Ste24p [Desulfobulbus propionicus]|nr:MAG: peptidase M48 Ste24p [Desulfobulbus propionicus]
MIYNNLIYFMVVIFLYSTQSVSEQARYAPWHTLLLTAAVFYGYWLYSRKAYSMGGKGGPARYFKQETKLSVLAVIVFVTLVFGLDMKYYLHPLSLDGAFPFFENLAGLGVFFFLLSLMWCNQKAAYEQLFGRGYTTGRYILSNIKANAPIVLPWLILSLLFDSLTLLPMASLHASLLSSWGDLVLFIAFLCTLILVFPPLVKRLWGCSPLPPGPLRTQMEACVRKQNLSFDILYWPLFEGRVLTACIMGIIAPFRYLLITPALLETLTPRELESVLAHEIGHVRKKHMLLYIALFCGFSILINALLDPLRFSLLGSDFFYSLVRWLQVTPDALLWPVIWGGMLILLIVYFRFVFGYFIRNFERQADAFVFHVQQTAAPLVASFEKIAALSGSIREEKNWHHFGIGERIAFLLLCEEDRSMIVRHDRKVYLSLLVYFCCLLLLVGALYRVDGERLLEGYELKYYEATLSSKPWKAPESSLLAFRLGLLYQEKQLERKAIAAYEQALALQTINPGAKNNLAWLLLTADDRELRDPVRALALASSAALIEQSGLVLDTLATACWANGLIEEAVYTERQAMEKDAENRAYYQKKLDLFLSAQWEEVDAVP